MAKKLSDRQYRILSGRIREFERRVDNLEIPFDDAVNALKCMTHKNALEQDLVQILTGEVFTKEQAMVIATLLKLNGPVISLSEEDNIVAEFDVLPSQNGRKQGIFWDFRSMPKHGIRVSYDWNDHLGAENILFEIDPLSSVEWPNDYEYIITLLVIPFYCEFNEQRKHSFMKKDETVFLL